MKKLIALLLVCIVLIPTSASAAIPYMSHGFVPYASFGFWRLDEEGNSFGRFFMQAPYKPASPMPVIGNPLFVDGESVQGLHTPMDLFICADDYIFVVDMNQNRAVKMTDRSELILEFGDEYGPGQLNNPEGVFVRRETGEVYISDTGNFRVAIFSPEGEFLREITRPDDARIQDIMFRPERIGVDSRGFYVIQLKGENRGLMLLTPNEEFSGFFGANRTQFGIIERIQSRFYSIEQRLATQTVQNSVSDMYIDNLGFIYTVTPAADNEQIKKFNIGAQNLFRDRQMDVAPIETVQQGWFEGIRTAYSGVTVDARGNVFALDSGAGRIFMFDAFGEPVFSFGAQMHDRGNITVGLFGNPTSMRVNSTGTLFVTDLIYRGVLVFTPTPFASQIKELNYLSADGRWHEAVPLAREILQENVFFMTAHMVIGMAYFQDQEWELARSYFRRAFNAREYSEAFWEYRLIFIQQNFVYGFLIILVIVFLFGVKNVVQRKRKQARE